jgi:hypothetical protein
MIAESPTVPACTVKATAYRRRQMRDTRSAVRVCAQARVVGVTSRAREAGRRPAVHSGKDDLHAPKWRSDGRTSHPAPRQRSLLYATPRPSAQEVLFKLGVTVTPPQSNFSPLEAEGAENSGTEPV